jgi:hypothetical protein
MVAVLGLWQSGCPRNGCCRSGNSNFEGPAAVQEEKEMKNTDDHLLGQPVDIRGWVSDALSGRQRHPLDTDEVLHLTLYGQEGDLQVLPVRRTRDMEIFQEWLRRYDRYTPNPRLGSVAAGVSSGL